MNCRADRPTLFLVGSASRLPGALRALRERARLTQAELERQAKLGASSLSRYERDEERPSLRTLESILEALGATWHDLAGAIDEANGRAPAPRQGEPKERLVRAMADGVIDRHQLRALAAGAGVGEDPRADADFVASAVTAAERMALDVVERLRAASVDLAAKYPQLDAPIGATIHEPEPIGTRRRKR